MPPETTWPGTEAEMTEWQSVMVRLMEQSDPDCGCGGYVNMAVTCKTHQEATQNQRWLNGLVMMRRRRYRLLKEEGVEP